MPFFLFSSVKMKRGEKLSLLLCDRWKEREVLPKILWCSTSLLSLDLPATEDSSTFPILG